MRQYADSAALAAYPGGDAVAAGDADALLRTASRMVDQLLVGRVYDTDAAGYPTDPDNVQALEDATCAIAVELDATGATSGGATEAWDSVGIGSVKLSGRRAAEGTVTVLGLPVPPLAVVHLLDVGNLRWWVT